MKQVILVVITLLATTICWAQSKPVSNYWAFSKPMAYGKELVDLEGNPVPRADTAYFIYLETKQGIPPKIQTVNFKGVKWYASVHLVPELKVEVGTHHHIGKKVVISRKPKYYLWRAELSPSSQLMKADSSPMLIKGKMGNNSFQLFIRKMTLLASEIVG